MILFARGNLITNQPDILCEWRDCSATAAKHVRFRFKIFDGVDGPYGRGVSSLADHHDVCDPHAAEAFDEYSEVLDTELGTCPDRCVPNGNF